MNDYTPFADDERLTALLRVCGHYLYHASGPGRAQTQILYLLAQQDGLSQLELQQALGIQSGSVSELISKLECKGLVARGRDEADRRRVTLRLTEAGRAALARRAQRPDVAVRYSRLTPQDRAQLAELLEKVIDGWKEDGASVCGFPRRCAEPK